MCFYSDGLIAPLQVGTTRLLSESAIDRANRSMAEETQNPSRNVPNAMVSAMALTYVTGMISIALLLLSISPEDVAVIKSHNFPVVRLCIVRTDARATFSPPRSINKPQSHSALC